MIATSSKFAPPTEQDVTRLVTEYPFAWVVTVTEGDFAATPLPLRPRLDAAGAVTEIVGHFARTNPHVELLRRVPRSLLLFMGPHGYVSPSWLSDRTRAPTWNYATVQYLVDIEFVEEAAATDALLRDLVGAMETGREEAWSVDDMGSRYGRLMGGIIGFRAHIADRRVKFKLGQDERDSEYVEILAALDDSGDRTLLEWMQRSNQTRRAGQGGDR